MENPLNSSNDLICKCAKDFTKSFPSTVLPCAETNRLPIDRGQPFTFTFQGQPVEAYEGETIAAALLAQGQRALRLTDRHAQPRALFCNMGVCFDCLVEVDGNANRRACQLPAAPGMQVRLQPDTTSLDPPAATEQPS